jgi:hypothetical protein
VNEIYLINACFGIVCAGIGYGYARGRHRLDVDTVVSHTLNQLIESGYVRTRGQGPGQLVLKWDHTDTEPDTDESD